MGAGHLPKPVASPGLGQPRRILGRVGSACAPLQQGVWVAQRQGDAFGEAALYPGEKTVLKTWVSLTGGGGAQKPHHGQREPGCCLQRTHW